jgi:LEM3 (ligand-effect modulator 3) family / CDC50 family
MKNPLEERPPAPSATIVTRIPNLQEKNITLPGRSWLRSKIERITEDIAQQELPGDAFILTPSRGIFGLLLTGIFTLTLGLIFLIFALEVTEHIFDYTNAGNSGKFSFVLEQTDQIYIYVRFSNTYRNTKFYADSIDYDQLEAGYPKAGSSDCSPWSESYYPCGVIAGSAFNDTFIVKVTDSVGMTTFASLDDSADSISWAQLKSFQNPSDMSDSNFATNQFWIAQRFPLTTCQPISATTTVQEFDVETRSISGSAVIADCNNYFSDNPTCEFSPSCAGNFYEVLNSGGWGLQNGVFLNWISSLGVSPTSQILVGVTESKVASGTAVTVEFVSRWPSGIFEGSKKIVVTTTNWQGGRNLVLPIGLISVGGLYILSGLLIGAIWRKNPRSLGDSRNFHFEYLRQNN